MHRFSTIALMVIILTGIAAVFPSCKDCQDCKHKTSQQKEEFCDDELEAAKSTSDWEC
jgi:uncharacterized membrane protein YuzA (DUF378 family)